MNAHVLHTLEEPNLLRTYVVSQRELLEEATPLDGYPLADWLLRQGEIMEDWFDSEEGTCPTKVKVKVHFADDIGVLLRADGHSVKSGAYTLRLSFRKE